MARKIYVVTRGEYSDYGIVAIFSTRQNAETFITRDTEYSAIGNIRGFYRWSKPDDFSIEEWELDGLTPNPKRQNYQVSMLHNGNSYAVGACGRGSDGRGSSSAFVANNNIVNSAVGYWLRSRGKSSSDVCMTTTVFAESLEHAVKIANEKRLYEIANNHWGIESPPQKMRDGLRWCVLRGVAAYKVLEGTETKKDSLIQFFHASRGIITARTEYDRRVHELEIYAFEVNVETSLSLAKRNKVADRNASDPV